MLHHIFLLVAAVFLASTNEPLKADLSAQAQYHQQRSSPTGPDALTLRFRNRVTGKCLDAGSNGNIFSRDCNKGLSQSWQIVNRLQLRNIVTDQCLEMSQGRIFTRPCIPLKESQNWDDNMSFAAGWIKNLKYRLCIDEHMRPASCTKGLGIVWERI